MLRMRDESGALVQPIEFIPAAERYNVMPAIDRWVVRHALSVLAHRASDPHPPYTISINLSGTSLNDDRFLEFLINELAQETPSPGAICFEITETAAVSNLANVVYFMRELKNRGCRFSLDDFGSGLSSFMYLKTLPVDLSQDRWSIHRERYSRSHRPQHGRSDQPDRPRHADPNRRRAGRVTGGARRKLARLGVSYALGFSHRADRVHLALPVRTGADCRSAPHRAS